MLAKLRHALFGDLTQQEAQKIGLLSLIFMFLIGAYWTVRPLKDAVFMSMVGRAHWPKAKMASWVLVMLMTILYAKLVDLMPKHRLFYFFFTIYGILLLGGAYLLADPAMGIANRVASPDRLLGWLFYLGSESYGSFMPALFWSFVVSSTDTSLAKRGYGLIIGGAQLGAIAGPELGKHATQIGVPTIVLCIAVAVFLVPLLVALFVRQYPAVVEKPTEVAAKKTGFLEGLRLLLSQSYLIGLLGVATLYEIIGTIIDYQFKALAYESCGSAEKAAEFYSLFAQCANGLALVFAIIGTSFFIRRFGLTFCLVTYPICVGIAVLSTWMNPTLWFFFGAMMAVKGLSYALNNPCKEILYIPTSKDAKFKAKSWIDSFGGRSSKALGAAITDRIPALADLVNIGSMVSLVVIAVWLCAAVFVGTANARLVREGRIIE